MIENHRGVYASAIESNFRNEGVQWWRPVRPNESDDLSRFDMVASLDEIPRLMTVACLQPIIMLDDDEISITEIRSGTFYHAIKSGIDFVIRPSFDVYTGMMTGSAVGTNHMTAGQRIAPLLFFAEIREIELVTDLSPSSVTTKSTSSSISVVFPLLHIYPPYPQKWQRHPHTNSCFRTTAPVCAVCVSSNREWYPRIDSATVDHDGKVQ